MFSCLRTAGIKCLHVTLLSSYFKGVMKHTETIRMNKKCSTIAFISPDVLLLKRVLIVWLLAVSVTEKQPVQPVNNFPVCSVNLPTIKSFNAASQQVPLRQHMFRSVRSPTKMCPHPSSHKQSAAQQEGGARPISRSPSPSPLPHDG